MAHHYETDPFKVIRAAFVELAESALYAETDMGEYNPCPDYCDMLRATIDQIMTAKSFADLSAVEWIAGKAALNAD
jgi:hypothetical protein